MDFEKEDNVREEDAVMEYEGGFRLVCDPKSLLYLFGMQVRISTIGVPSWPKKAQKSLSYLVCTASCAVYTAKLRVGGSPFTKT